MPTPRDNARRAAWSTYWAGGALHSCAGSYRGNYEGAIGAFWRGILGSIGPGERVLDLATGNGALPLMAWELAGDRGALRVDAVDLADIAPRWHRPADFPGLRFHGGVAMESLPFDDATFDLVVSQFGFEYAERGPALAECLRVASPRARIALVMHHAESVLARVAREELAHQERLLAPGGLLAAADALLPDAVQAATGLDPSPGLPAAREGFERALAAVDRAIAASHAPDLLVEARDGIRRLLAGRGSLEARRSALATYRQALQDAVLRTGELIEHALDADAVEAMVQAVRAAWPDARFGVAPLSQAEGLLGWAFTVERQPRR